ncbi:MAG: hypothetical protein M3065_11350 [Actinomycetota bacterium]|nr:hypothetical protein [Actinomycetota bacterium]
MSASITAPVSREARANRARSLRVARMSDAGDLYASAIELRLLCTHEAPFLRGSRRWTMPPSSTG